MLSLHIDKTEALHYLIFLKMKTKMYNRNVGIAITKVLSSVVDVMNRAIMQAHLASYLNGMGLLYNIECLERHIKIVGDVHL